ncbi:MAG: hypothetical protein V8Q84_06045 [Bilophila sp.]
MPQPDDILTGVERLGIGPDSGTGAGGVSPSGREKNPAWVAIIFFSSVKIGVGSSLRNSPST